MKAIFLTLLLAAGTPAMAADFWTQGVFQTTREAVPPGITLKRVLKLSTDQNNDITYLSVMMNEEGQVAGFYGANTAPAEESFTGDEEAAARNVFRIEEIESSKGAVLAEAKGRKALILNGKLDRATQEGRFTIRYLSNGLFNSYKSCDFNLRKTAKGWAIQNAYTGRVVTAARVTTHSLGITTIEGICPE